jgi:hypothetical protein
MIQHKTPWNIELNCGAAVSDDLKPEIKDLTTAKAQRSRSSRKTACAASSIFQNAHAE